ncbi:single-stranded DNA-binding protein [Treponema sp.]|uniref:single-stranded DNA-binding protein n=1 Tax=Treponema sp. TaxID=166 RepID=UPI003F00387B
MNALNQIIIEGNVVRQPEKKSCKNGAAFCRVPIAVNRKYKGGDGSYIDEVSYFDIATFGQTAELCEKWCSKGRGIRVVGRLKQTTLKSEDGKKRSSIEIIAEHIDFKPLAKKDPEENSSGTENNSRKIKSRESLQEEFREPPEDDDLEF